MQVVRLWGPNGDKLSSMRTSTSLLATRMGPITQLAFHPYRLLFAAGGQDRLVAIYTIAPGLSSAASTASASSMRSSFQSRPPTFANPPRHP
jgi:hypothetical protein